MTNLARLPLRSFSALTVIVGLTVTACGPKTAQTLPPPGVEVAAEPGAEDGANKPIDGRVAISDAELKAAAKRAKAAQEDAKVARGRKNQQQRRDRGKDDGKERDTTKPAEPEDTDVEGDGTTPPPKAERKPLPRNPNPPATVPAPADVAAPPADAQRTPAGVWHKLLKAGTGTTHPTEDDQVVVHYTGWTVDGKLFDSSVVRGQPIRLGLGQVIAGWRDGVRLMVTGETRRLWIPESMAYQGRAGAPKGMLVFDVELLEIEAP